ncbi:MAG TPA: lipo-like protein [Rhizobiales bacterium]|nr:lipo-like protein [Hyphomicrobiales bacterium]
MIAETLLDKFGKWMAARLEKEVSGYRPYTPFDPETLCRVLQPGDIILIDGGSKVSTMIKYLTQSTWSHAAMFVGNAMPEPEDGAERPRLIEVELGKGAIASPLSKYATYNIRICRPIGLSRDDCARLVNFMVERLGTEYDMKNIIDLARYLLPTFPVPLFWRRRMLALGSGSPTRAICSTMIAESFQSLRYPILPRIEIAEGAGMNSGYSQKMIYHIRHHSLFAPRDFDLSPYFKIIKPTIEFGFDYHGLNWAEKSDRSEDSQTG